MNKQHSTTNPQQLRICFVITTPFAANAYMHDHFSRLIADGHKITLCVNTEEIGAPLKLPAAVLLHHIPIRRKISPLSDTENLCRLFLFLLSGRFNIVHSLLPKSGMLAMLAALLARVPIRIHTFTGQIWATRQGISKLILKSFDRLIAACATKVMTDSPSQREYLISENVVARKKIDVLGQGSICGVDTKRFAKNEGRRKEIRASLDISNETCVFLFVGRLTSDKGVNELVTAFLRLIDQHLDVRLLFVGPDEERLSSNWKKINQIIVVPHTSQVEAYYSAGDVLCLPSHREGFGSVLIEAGSSGLPVIASKIYGITDAVVDKQTGLLHSVGNIDQIYELMKSLAENPSLRFKLGENGKHRAEMVFSSKKITNEMSQFYGRLALKLKN